MKDFFLDKAFWQGVASNLLVLALVAGFGYVMSWANVAILRWQRPGSKRRLADLLLVASLFALVFAMPAATIGGKALLSVVALALFYNSRELRRFWSAGMIQADSNVKVGLDYKQALNTCHNEIWFMGAGASKLVNAQGFEDAVRRCNRSSGGTLKFLLEHPRSRILREAAIQASQPKEQYQHKVRQSLRRLADLRKDSGLLIDVRFYEETQRRPIVRLFFADDRWCLFSYYVFGEGDGSQLPQLHVQKFTKNRRDVGSFYHPLRELFRQAWEASQPWDFVSYFEEDAPHGG